MTLLSLLIRHLLALCSGWFASVGIDGSSSVGIVTGLLVFLIATAWSLGEKWLNLKPGQLTDAAMVRSIAGSLASQIVTALAAVLAVDANNPELLVLAVLNVVLSKFGVHQRLVGSPAVKVLVMGCAVLSLSSCGTFTKADAQAAGEVIGLAAADAAIVIARMELVNAEAELANAAAQPGADQRVILAKQLGVMAAKKALDEAQRAIAKQRAKTRTSAKQPVDVTYRTDGADVPECLRRVSVPDYGARVAAHLAAN